MMDVEHLRLPPAVGTALADARNATDALLETDPLSENLQQRYGAAAVALQNWPPSQHDWPGVPNKYHHVTRKTKTNDQFRDSRQAWYDAMANLKRVGWAGMSNAEKQYRKRQKQRHEAERMDGGSPPPNSPLERSDTRARSARRDSKGAWGSALRRLPQSTMPKAKRVPGGAIRPPQSKEHRAKRVPGSAIRLPILREKRGFLTAVAPC